LIKSLRFVIICLHPFEEAQSHSLFTTFQQFFLPTLSQYHFDPKLIIEATIRSCLKIMTEYFRIACQVTARELLEEY